MANNKKSTHDNYVAKGGESGFSKEDSNGNTRYLIGNVNSNEGNGIFAKNAPPSSDNLRWSNNISILRDYFSSRDSYQFKYGLEIGDNPENQIEDPVIFGFDLVINHSSSALYSGNSPKSPISGDLDNFFSFAESAKLDEITKRRDIYNKFMEQLEILFLTTNSGKFDTFKAHYLTEIIGLKNLINQTSGIKDGKQFSKFGEDMIKLKVREDVTLSGGYLAALYKTLTYNKLSGKLMIPENLLRFDCSIIISEVRNYNRVVKSLGSGDVSTAYNVFNDNVSRYIYNLYDCQFVFDTMSHDDTVSNTKSDTVDTWEMGFYYKYSNMMMEKFKLNKDLSSQTSVFLNDGGIDPSKNLQGSIVLNSASSGSNGIGTSKVYGYGYNSKTREYMSINGIPKNNGVLSSDEEFSRLMTEYDNQVSPLNTASDNSSKLNDEAIKEKNVKLKKIFSDTKDMAVNKLKTARDELINNTIKNIRTATGLRRINSPTNVYEDYYNSVPGFFIGELRNFANDGITDFLSNTNKKVNATRSERKRIRKNNKNSD